MRFTLNCPDSKNADQTGKVQGYGSKIEFNMPRKDILKLAYRFAKIALGFKHVDSKTDEVIAKFDNRVWKDIS